MKPEIKEKWLAALRSGEYKQGKNALRNCNEFCCLGVLADVYLNEHPDPNGEWKEGYPADSYYFNYRDADGDNVEDGEYLPAPVMHWAGLPNYNPEVNGNNLKLPLSEFNDMDYTFSQIADFIEDDL